MSFGSEEKEAVLRVLDRGILSGYQGNWSDAFYGGPEVRALESEWAEYFGVKHAIAVNSATSGLWAACAAIGLQRELLKRDNMGAPFSHRSWNEYEMPEIICTPWSMTCSASIPLHFGAMPVFADIEPDYYCLDPKSIEERITDRTKAIIVVDIFGQCYDADAINEIAARKGKEYGQKIYVIEDAAQAAGAKYKGKYAGTLGDIGVFSLNVHKPIQCGEGGIVVTNNQELAFKLRLAMNHGEAVINDRILKKFPEPLPLSCNIVGMNLRMTELSAAIAREQLKKLENIINIQQEYARYFNVKVRPECKHSYYRYPMLCPENRKYKDGIYNIDLTDGSVPRYFDSWNESILYYHLKNHYITPIYKMPLFRNLGYEDNLCPVCERVEENIILAWLKDVI
jgi:dTDP-4-amino-4,6-dideoxygalactose transaminase